LNQLRWGGTPVRYGFTFLSLAMISFIGVFGKLLGSTKPICSTLGSSLFIAITFAQLLFQLALNHQQYFWIGACISIIFSLAILLGMYLISNSKRRLSIAFVALCCLVTLIIPVNSLKWHHLFDEFYEPFFGTQKFSQVLQTSDRTLVVMDDRIYPYFGSQRTRRIIHPLRFFDGATLTASLKSVATPCVVVRQETTKRNVYRYRGAFEFLRKDKEYELIDQIRDVALFRLRPTVD